MNRILNKIGLTSNDSLLDINLSKLTNGELAEHLTKVGEEWEKTSLKDDHALASVLLTYKVRIKMLLDERLNSKFR